MDVINVCTPGHADPYDSFGLIACQLARHLSALGCYINLIAVGNRVLDTQPADVRAVAEQPVKAAFGGILGGYPTVYRHYGALANIGRRVAVCMFESTVLPRGWVDTLNELNAVIVPSQFCETVFMNCGVTTPIHVVPLGVGDVYRPAGRAPGRPFTFLAFLDRGLRKGGVTALQAFYRAFGDDPAYRLILKRRKSHVQTQIINANVEEIAQDMTDQELYELYLKCDCLVNPNKGEGFGLIPREFAATGGISLATNWGGTADDIGLWGVPLPYKLVPADWSRVKSLAGQSLGEWAEVDVDDLAVTMRSVADNRVYHQWIAAQVAPAVRELYDWRKFAERVYEVWRAEPCSTFGFGSMSTVPGDGDGRVFHNRGMSGSGYEIPLPA